jgi:AcrR family transcriptional regulator
MSDTKENIMITALRLFARDGYEAVSVSRILGELGMAKSALYNHYKNKRDIFDSIVARMNQMDYERAKEYKMPEGTMEEMAEAYGQTSLEKIKTYSEAQFFHWTKEEFSSLFRKMLTLEQYRSEEMATLYQQYLVSEPVGYMEDLFGSIIGNYGEAKQLAVAFYAPIFLMYSLYDNAKNEDDIAEMLHVHIDQFFQKIDLKGKIG